MSFLEESDVLRTRISAALIFYCTLDEFENIKHLLKDHLNKLVYQKISADPLWIILKKEVKTG